MRLDFNKWQSYLIVFAPIIILEIFNIASDILNMPYDLAFTVSSLLFFAGTLVCYGAQFYVGLRFFRQSQQGNLVFVIICSIPLLFIAYTCMYIVYNWHGLLNVQRAMLSPQKQKLSDVISFWLAGYTAVTYLLVNNNIIRWNLSKVQEPEIKSSLKQTYLLPLKRIVRISFALYVITVVTSIILEYYL
ncbi:MAG: hypothetical protein JO080_07170 [Mucilaginibacter sp.]|nr:hypothetical protein [Mucilaginibacter sp.]